MNPNNIIILKHDSKIIETTTFGNMVEYLNSVWDDIRKNTFKDLFLFEYIRRKYFITVGSNLSQKGDFDLDLKNSDIEFDFYLLEKEIGINLLLKKIKEIKKTLKEFKKNKR